MTSEQVNLLKRMVDEDNQSYVHMAIEPHCYNDVDDWYCHFYLPNYNVMNQDEFKRIEKYAKAINGYWHLSVMKEGIWSEEPKPYFTLFSR